ncbi:hypothetical protein SCYAM73S_03330 [Streptomyces cyaneofuscatus]
MPPRTTDSAPERRDDDHPPRPGRGRGCRSGRRAAPDFAGVAEGGHDTDPVPGAVSTGGADSPGTHAANGTGTEGTPGTHDHDRPRAGNGSAAEGDPDGHGGSGPRPENDPGAGERVAAVRRAADGGRRWRAAHLAGCAALLAVALTGGAVAFGSVGDGRAGAGVEAVSAGGALAPGVLARGDLDSGIGSLQKHLRAQPRDFGSWATLGIAYVEQARTNGDPSRYPQAERALKRSLELDPGNDQALSQAGPPSPPPGTTSPAR